ncbi:ALP1-like protein isoform X1 [Tanacetum coccineum]
MNRSLFTRIVRDLSANCPYFQEGCDAVGKAGISALVKCTSAIRQLAYAAVPDSLDEYLQIGEKTSRDCLMHFCNGVMSYMARSSIDCTKWPWAQCPQAYRAQFSRGDSGSEPFILLEAVASQDLWIWHAFFGVAGSNNDVNVLRQSPVLNDLKVGKAPEVPFVANDVTYKWGYYFTDGIYPEWAVLLKSISQPGSNDVKRIRYKQSHGKQQEKMLERAL